MQNIVGAFNLICKETLTQIEESTANSNKISILVNLLTAKKSELFLVNEQDWTKLEEVLNDSAKQLNDQILMVQEIFEGVDSVFDPKLFNATQSTLTKEVVEKN